MIQSDTNDTKLGRRNMVASAQTFDWFRDSAGYALQVASEGKPASTSDVLLNFAGAKWGNIIRQGGALEPVAIKIEGLHKAFAKVRAADDALRFVQAHGFLRFSGGESESVEDILRATAPLREAMQARKNMLEFHALPPDDPALQFCRRVIADAWRTSAKASVRVVMTAEGNGLALSIAPINLLGAIWCDFANDLLGVVTTRACENCGKIFEIGQGAARTNKRTCSTRCRTALVRKNQKGLQQ